LQKRSIPNVLELQEDMGLEFMDLTYSHSNKIFHSLVREGFIKDEDSPGSLWSFLEVVSFVHCWIEMEVKRRVSRQKFESLNLVFTNIKSSWGLFFADPPDEPRLENESVASVCSIITNKCYQYHSSYLSDLQTHGWLHAFRTCCAAFLENVLPGYIIQDEDKDIVDDLDKPLVRDIGEMVYDLDRDIHTMLAQRKF